MLRNARQLLADACLLALVSAVSIVNAQAPAYPATKKGDVVDDYHGTKVGDPYRWFEDLGSAETKAWIDAENAVTLPYLERLPQRPALVERLTQLWNYPRTSLPLREAGQIFYRQNTGLQKQAPLYRRTSLTAPAQLLLDPNTLSADGSISLAQWQPSPDGRYLAYGLSQGGADWADVHVREIATGKDLPGVVRWFRFSGISWTKDSKGFFYARFPEPPQGKALEADLKDHQIWYHRAGTTQDQDRLIYWRKELPRYFVGADVTDDGRYLIVALQNGTDPKNRLFYADLGDPMHPNIGAPIVAIVDEDIAQLDVLGNKGPVLFVRTDLDAPNRRIIAIDPRLRTGRAGWKSVVPESKNALEHATMAGDRLFCQYLVDVKAEVKIFSLAGKDDGALDLPGISSVQGMSGRESVRELFYAVTSPLIAPTVYRYDLATRHSGAFEASKPAFDPSGYETRQVFYTSKDGTRIPMFITGRKGLVLDGSNPAWLYGYGGFSISITPAYRISLPAWLEMGGIYVQPALRGGAEYGEEWHRAGKFEKKQNVFDDFIAAAEYLDPGKVHVVVEARDRGRLQRRPPRRRGDDAAARPFRRRDPRGRRARHAPLRLVHRRVGVGGRVRLGAEVRRVRLPDPLFAAAEREARHVLSGDARRHGGSRRPRRAEPFVQVRRGAAGGAGLCEAGADPRRDPVEPRLQPDRQADRRARRRAVVRGEPGGHQTAREVGRVGAAGMAWAADDDPSGRCMPDSAQMPRGESRRRGRSRIPDAVSVRVAAFPPGSRDSTA